MSERKSSYEYDSELTLNEKDYDTKSSNDNESNIDSFADDDSELSELEFSDEEEEEESDDDEYEWAPTLKEQRNNIREKEREKKSNSKSNQSSSHNSFVIPHESVFIPMGTKDSVDKMLAYRSNPENNAEEILVKYKTMSYLDVEWINRKKLESNIGKNRVRKFIEKYLYTQTSWSVDEIFNPNFTKMDRIIDEGELGDKIYYLVKWKSLSYDDCTWEPRELVLDMDPDVLNDYERFRSLKGIEQKKLSYANKSKRPSVRDFKKLEKSPIYKGDNELRSYQLEALNWLTYCWMNGHSSILADEMGLGKTVQSISFLNRIYNEYNVRGPFLVIAPLSTISNWEREFRTWTDLNCVVFHGKESSRNFIIANEFYYRNVRNEIIHNIYKLDVLLTTYEMAIAAAPQLQKVKWRVAVLDEAHRLKNKSSKVAETLKQFKMEHRILLTGTPLQNSLDELWSLLNFLEPHRFNSESSFMEKYGKLNSAEDVERIQNLLKPIMLRRLKEDVEQSIPLKEETVVEVTLTTVQKKYYRAILEKNLTWLKKGTKKNNMPNLVNTMIELRKCCIHPFLIKGAEERILKEDNAITPEEQFKSMINASGKLVLTDKLLHKLHKGGSKVLIFSQMTQCLDILADYLTGRNWKYERIDGSIRGELRQAAIDRFSDKNSESFVFLLCTRAGGVGINLTVADTVIIFDSDWNPQNDLQAQARVHRIGQTKTVQIYRLITANTYEREMFDRAGLKLGLDKAILQKMDVYGNDDHSKPPSSLSPKEIEELLKRGAYGALMDDEESVKFCEEDIDQILERRATVVRHDTGERSSIFSKATFSVSQNDEDVDVNDTNFWDKFAKKANLEEVYEPSESEKLIVFERRHRKQVQRFGIQNEEIEQYFSEVDDEHPKKKNEKVYPWCYTERVRFERCLMQYGYGSWNKIIKQFSRRSVNDLKACAHSLVQFCLEAEKCNADLLKDIKEIFAMPENIPSYENGTPMERSKLIIDPDIPYLKATKKQISEFKSFLIDANEDYKQHLKKKAKNLLSRLQLMHVIHNRIMKRSPEEKFPTMLSAPPTDWWGEQEDRDLIKGVHKYGYQQYEAIRNDEEFCFCKRKYKTNDSNVNIHENESTVGDNESKADIETNDNEDSILDSSTDKLALSASENNEKQKIKEESTNKIKTEEKNMEIDDPDNKSEIKKEDISIVKAEDENNVKMEDSSEVKKEENKDEILYVWPCAGDIGTRLRKIVSAYQRLFIHEIKQKEKMEKLEKHKQQIQANRQQMLQTKAKEKLDRIRSHLSKSEKITFQRTISSYGIMNKNENGTRDWSNFKRLSNLDKTDKCMEDYYEELMDICKVVIKRDEEKRNKEKEKNEKHENENENENENEGKEGKEEGNHNTKSEVQTPASEAEGKKHDKYENFTVEKAKRLLRRIDLLKKLREVILKKDDLDDLLKFAKKPARSGLPNWWVCGVHDKALLQSIAEYGILRPDLTISDPKYPFKELIEKAREEEQKEAVIDISDKKENENSSSVQSSITRYVSSNATQMEKDWMKEMVIVRRFESLCDMVLNEKKVNRLKRMRSNVSKKSETESINGDEHPNKKTKYTLKFHISTFKNSSDTSPSKDHKKNKKRSSNSDKHKKSKYKKLRSNTELDREIKKILQNRKRKALAGIDSDSSIDSDDSDSDTNSNSISDSDLSLSDNDIKNYKKKKNSSSSSKHKNKKHHRHRHHKTSSVSSISSLSSDSDSDSESDSNSNMDTEKNSDSDSEIHNNSDSNSDNIESPRNLHHHRHNNNKYKHKHKHKPFSPITYDSSSNDSGMDTDEMLNRAEKNLNNHDNNNESKSKNKKHKSTNSNNNNNNNNNNKSYKNTTTKEESIESSKPTKKRIKLFRTNSPKLKITSKILEESKKSKKDSKNTHTQNSNNSKSTKQTTATKSSSKQLKNKDKTKTTPSPTKSKTTITNKLPKIKFKSKFSTSSTNESQPSSTESNIKSKSKSSNDQTIQVTTSPKPKKRSFLQEYPTSSSSSSDEEDDNDSENNNNNNNNSENEEESSSSSSESDVWLGTTKKN
ncbi:SNF2 family N-terminal domain-containing protein [Neocallimastix lanati (nom. inval.)]|nr:SNF2 family N-terminal domain-containing protein [Neocallimastix sp. JGI-2020a]